MVLKLSVEPGRERDTLWLTPVAVAASLMGVAGLFIGVFFSEVAPTPGIFARDMMKASVFSLWSGAMTMSFLALVVRGVGRRTLVGPKSTSADRVDRVVSVPERNMAEYGDRVGGDAVPSESLLSLCVERSRLPDDLVW